MAMAWDMILGMRKQFRGQLYPRRVLADLESKITLNSVVKGSNFKDRIISPAELLAAGQKDRLMHHKIINLPFERIQKIKKILSGDLNHLCQI